MWAMWGWLVWLGKRRLTWECAYVGGGKPSGASADPSLGVLHTRVACLSDDWPRGCRDSAWTLGTGLMGPLSGTVSTACHPSINPELRVVPSTKGIPHVVRVKSSYDYSLTYPLLCASSCPTKKSLKPNLGFMPQLYHSSR